MKKLIFILSLLLFTGYGHTQEKSETKTCCPSGKNACCKAQKTGKLKEDGLYALMYTSKGLITLNLEFEKAPMTVANFIGLAKGKFTVHDTIKFKKPLYKDVKFHRVIKNFMIQGGDPAGNGSGGPGYSFFDETTKELRHSGKGILSMANSDPQRSKAPYSNLGKTNGSQFFITHKATPHLDGLHTVFGNVVRGINIVDSIQQDDIIEEIKIKAIGKAAKKFKATKVFNAEFDKNQLLFDSIMEVKKQKQLEVKRISKLSLEDYKKEFIEKNKKLYPNAEVLASGLMIVRTEAGSGEKPQIGDNVKVHYKGMLDDGTVFDSSFKRNKPFTFGLGKRQVIKGWDEGIAVLSKGEKATLIIPYYLGYGARANRAIPAYATLIFDVQLLEFGK